MSTATATVKTETRVGGYTEFTTEIPTEASEVFKKATHNLMGVKYVPLAFSMQVVEGRNYRFFCSAHIVKPDAVYKGAIIDIFQPLKGDPQIKGDIKTF